MFFVKSGKLFLIIKFGLIPLSTKLERLSKKYKNNSDMFYQKLFESMDIQNYYYFLQDGFGKGFTIPNEIQKIGGKIVCTCVSFQPLLPW